MARTQSQIREYMDKSIPSPSTEPNLLAYYTFDNLTNKQGNAAWDGTIVPSLKASINATNPSCVFEADSCCLDALGNVIPCVLPLTFLSFDVEGREAGVTSPKNRTV